MISKRNCVFSWIRHVCSTVPPPRGLGPGPGFFFLSFFLSSSSSSPPRFASEPCSMNYAGIGSIFPGKSVKFWVDPQVFTERKNLQVSKQFGAVSKRGPQLYLPRPATLGGRPGSLWVGGLDDQSWPKNRFFQIVSKLHQMLP